LRNVKIGALGCYTPPGVLTNEDLEKMVQTNHDWIVNRTGIERRHIAPPDIATSDMAAEAARVAIEQRGIDPGEIDGIIVCTVTPDMMFPSTACLVQRKLGLSDVWGFDLIAACSGFVYGLTVAAAMVGSGMYEKMLVIGADTMSRIINYEDRATCILFGDGAGAMLIEPAAEGETGFMDFRNIIDGSGADFLRMPAGGSRMPASAETVGQGLHYVHQDGQQVFKYAVRTMYDICHTILTKNGLTADDVGAFIPHQANKRIILATAERLGIPLERVVINIGEYGNTTAATIPLATRDALDAGRLKKGDVVLIAAVGAGYTAGVNLWRWEM